MRPTHEFVSHFASTEIHCESSSDHARPTTTLARRMNTAQTLVDCSNKVAPIKSERQTDLDSMSLRVKSSALDFFVDLARSSGAIKAEVTRLQDFNENRN